MLQQQVYVINTILMVFDALAIVAAGYAAHFLKSWVSVKYMGYVWVVDTNVFVTSVLFVMFLNNYIMGKLELYSDSRPPSYFILFGSITQAIMVNFAILSALIFLLKMETYSRLFLLGFAAFSWSFLSIVRGSAQFFLSRAAMTRFNLRKILIVGDMEKGAMVASLLAKQMSWGHEIIGRLKTELEPESDEPSSGETLGTIQQLRQVLKDHAVDEVVFAVGRDRSINLLHSLEICKKTGTSVRILPALWMENPKSIVIDSIQRVPFLTMQSGKFNASGLLYKRILDLLGGLVGIPVLVALYPFIAIAIKLDSPGPVFFKQKRVGQAGRSFNLYKFRSMYEDAEIRKAEVRSKNVMTGAIFKVENDPRITRIGGWLRKTSLDELPQVWNVLKGEMSLVGTRPPTPDEVEKYQLQHLRRISAKPGITGLWQISGRNKLTDFEKIVELDCKYLDEWRFFNDIVILFKTILVLIQRKGAM